MLTLYLEEFNNGNASYVANDNSILTGTLTKMENAI
jgi:hypothetical protein